MKVRHQRGKRARHGARNWILKALESFERGQAVRTSEIRKKVRQLSGAKIPDYSLYQALRTLVRQRALRARRVGRERSYQLISGKPAAPVPKVARRPTKIAEPRTAAGQPLHKLAPGEVVILEIGVAHVESAANRRGRLVLERHQRPT
jgi:hypothetical protein